MLRMRFGRHTCFAEFVHMFAFIVNSDGLVKKLDEMERTADMYSGLIEHTKRLLKTIYDLSQTHKGIWSTVCMFHPLSLELN